MSAMELRELEPLLQKTLGGDVRVANFTSKSLLPPGENYGSTILAVHVQLQRDGKLEDLHLIAKMQPATAFQREIFQSPFSFRKEIYLYERILPLYKQLQLDSGIPPKEIFDIGPVYYGSRLSLKDNDQDFDDDAVILMLNLKTEGFYTADRRSGLDPEHAGFAIKGLAKFHALGLALKTQRPQDYEEVVKHCAPLIPEQMDEFEAVMKKLMKIIEEDPVTQKYVSRVQAAVEVSIQKMTTTDTDEPWSCILHTDFWVNNMMFRKNKGDNRVAAIKFVDFQNYFIASPVRELLFFILSSVEDATKWSRFDYLVNLYYVTLITALSALKCDVARYNRDSFDERLPMDIKAEFAHILFMMRVVGMPKPEVSEDGEVVKSLMLQQGFDERYIDQIKKLILLCVEKEWI